MPARWVSLFSLAITTIPTAFSPRPLLCGHSSRALNAGERNLLWRLGELQRHELVTGDCILSCMSLLKRLVIDPDALVQVSASGKQLLSKKKTQPRCAFSQAERFGKNYYSTAVSPGPGAYAA